MSWNHRILKRTYPGAFVETLYQVHEVYYDDSGKPTMCTENPISVTGETVEEIYETLNRMIKAAEKPVLDWDDFNTEEDSA